MRVPSALHSLILTDQLTVSGSGVSQISIQMQPMGTPIPRYGGQLAGLRG
jgi:hypothetical protein